MAYQVARYKGSTRKRQRTRGAQSFTRTTKRRRRTDASNNVTFQHDYAHIYSRRRAPPRVRRAARKRAYQFNKSLVGSLGQKTWVKTDYFDSGVVKPISLAYCQSLFSCGLWGAKDNLGIPDNAWGDLLSICEGNGTGIEDVAGKIWFSTGVMDVQIRNAGVVEDPDGENDVDTTGILVVDLYTIYARKEGYSDPAQDWEEAMSQQDLLDSGGVKSQPQSLNCVPFDAPGFGSSWLVAKKMRYRISTGQSVYLQMRDSKDKCFNSDRFEYDTSALRCRMKFFKGFSRGYLMTIRSDQPKLVNPPIDNTKTLKPYHFEIIYTKNYKFVQQESNRAGQVLNP